MLPADGDSDYQAIQLPDYQIHVSMRVERVGPSLFAALSLPVVVLSLATVWLFLTSPLTVAAAAEGGIPPFVRDTADVLLRAVESLLRYL